MNARATHASNPIHSKGMDTCQNKLSEKPNHRQINGFPLAGRLPAMDAEISYKAKDEAESDFTIPVTREQTRLMARFLFPIIQAYYDKKQISRKNSENE